jgi:hypothetical protein
MNKKPLKTFKETPTGRNLKSINKKTGEKKKNVELIKKVEKRQLPGYQVVKPAKIKRYLRSKPDNRKKNNLDPKIMLYPKIRTVG